MTVQPKSRKWPERKWKLLRVIGESTFHATTRHEAISSRKKKVPLESLFYVFFNWKTCTDKEFWFHGKDFLRFVTLVDSLIKLQRVLRLKLVGETNKNNAMKL